jgi:hypothetical protein
MEGEGFRSCESGQGFPVALDLRSGEKRNLQANGG